MPLLIFIHCSLYRHESGDHTAASVALQACGPTGELDCGSNAFLRGSCLVVHDDSFRIHDHFNVGLVQGEIIV